MYIYIYMCVCVCVCVCVYVCVCRWVGVSVCEEGGWGMYIYIYKHGGTNTPPVFYHIGFTYFFVLVWVYTITPIVAVLEMQENRI